MKEYLIIGSVVAVTVAFIIFSGAKAASVWTQTNKSIWSESNDDPVTVDFDVNGGDLLVLHLAGKDNTLSGRCREGGLPTYGGIEMVDSGFGSVSPRVDEMCAEMFYLVNPPDGVQTLVIPNTNSVPPGQSFYLVPILSAWTGVVDAPNVVDVANFSYNAGSADPQVDITTTGADRLVVDILADGFSLAPNGNSHTLIYQQDNGAEVCGAQYTLDDLSGGGTFSWTIPSDDWGMIVMAFLPASGEGDTCTYGGTGDWVVDCSDNCSISSNVVGFGGLGSAVLRINGAGRFSIQEGVTISGFDYGTKTGDSCYIYNAGELDFGG